MTAKQPKIAPITYSVSADCPVGGGVYLFVAADHVCLVSFLNSAGLRSPEATIFSSWRTGRPASVSSAISARFCGGEGVDT